MIEKKREMRERANRIRRKRVRRKRSEDNGGKYTGYTGKGRK